VCLWGPRAVTRQRRLFPTIIIIILPPTSGTAGALLRTATGSRFRPATRPPARLSSLRTHSANRSARQPWPPSLAPLSCACVCYPLTPLSCLVSLLWLWGGGYVCMCVCVCVCVCVRVCVYVCEENRDSVGLRGKCDWAPRHHHLDHPVTYLPCRGRRLSETEL
jgi:hypothetical protein